MILGDTLINRGVPATPNQAFENPFTKVFFFDVAAKRGGFFRASHFASYRRLALAFAAFLMFEATSTLALSAEDETLAMPAADQTLAVSSEDQTIAEPPITAADRDHWAFVPLDPALPKSADLQTPDTWSLRPLDRFILVALRDRDLRPLPQAAPTTLLRRVCFDVTGLPPSPEDIDAFLDDRSPLAYERLVDRLLASPDYGDRWAQHWLDVARFAETDGFEHDKPRPDAWRYRQWVIDALNDDLPYDRFVRLQLSGDLSELATRRPGESPDPHADAIATMFCTAGPDMPDLNEQELRRHDKLNEMTSTVGEVLLGLQFNCAQCHDHKYDPISQADFYRLRAIFEAAVPPLKRDVPLTTLSGGSSPPPARFYHRGQLDRPGPEVEPSHPRVLAHLSRSVLPAQAPLAGQPPGPAGVDPHASADPPAVDPRTAFADWLFAPDNPLPARVIANRIWLHHFGRSLAGNPSDFGVMGDGPSHPELLDHLADLLRSHGWGLKRLHREILLSATYRQAGDALIGDASLDEAILHNRRHDPDNTAYGRFPRRRLEGETIRDAILFASGDLDRRYGGTSVLPPLPQELVGTLLKGQWPTSKDAADHARRSVYLFARRNLRYPIFEAFDRPEPTLPCARRVVSTTPTQSLLMLNGELTAAAADKLAHSVQLGQSRVQLGQSRAGNDHDLRGTQFDTPPAPGLADVPPSIDEAITRLFRLTLSRPPSLPERKAVLEQIDAIDGQASDKLRAVALALLNCSDFVTID